MKQRNIIAVVILSIITLGIYDLYWLVSTKKVLNERTSVKVPTVWLLFAPAVFFMIGIGLQLASLSRASTGLSVAVVISMIVGYLAIIATTFYWLFKYSKAVGEYTNHELNTAMTFILLWLLRFVGIAIIQDKFNDIEQAGGSAAAVAQPVAAYPIQPPVADVYAPVAPEQPSVAPVEPVMTPPAPTTIQPEVAAAPVAEPTTVFNPYETPAEPTEQSPAVADSQTPPQTPPAA